MRASKRRVAAVAWACAGGWAVCAGGVAAQSYSDLTFVRDRPAPFASAFKARAGISGGIAQDEDQTIGLEDNVGLDGFIYYRNDRFTTHEAILDAYAGRDGAVVSLRENQPGEGGNRLELSARYFPFYREGFYRGDDFFPTGRYEGKDFGAYVGVGSVAAEDLSFEIGGFYRRFTFDRNEDTDTSYVIPDDFNAFGVRAFAEHSTLTLDRTYGLPADGFILTLMVEREQNDSDRSFGTPIFRSEIPSGLWRAKGHLEWFLPEANTGVWGLRVDASWSDDEDRIQSYDAQKPIGYIWIDGEVNFRFQFGGLAVTPFAQGQFIRFLEENGFSSDEELFYGGGGRLLFMLSDQISLYGEYSYLTNPSRPPVSASEDTFGEHQFFAGIEVVFGAQR